MEINRQEVVLILSSPPRLEAYLVDVGRRREANRLTRRRAYWLQALPRLNSELIGARDEDDAEIAAELEQVVGAFEAALADFPGPAPPTDMCASPPDNMAEFCPPIQPREDDAGHGSQSPCDTETCDVDERTGRVDVSTGDSDTGPPSDAEVRAGVPSLGVPSRRVSRESAVHAVVTWRQALVRLGRTRVVGEDDCVLLSLLLDDCVEAGVSPKDVVVRAALQDAIPVLMESQLRHHKYLKSLMAAQRRNGDLSATPEAAEPNAAPTDEFERMRQAVTRFTRGKRALMLGGKRRLRVQQELQDLLECEVEWAGSEPNDRAGKSLTKIESADIVLMVKNFASHELFHAGKDAMNRRGGSFIVLPSGYGTRQVVNQINSYLGRAQSESRH